MSTATAVAVIRDKGTLEGLMSNGSLQSSLKTVLPKHLTPERVVKMALVAASRQPLLFKCTQESFLQSVMKAAELGLDCSGTLGRAYLVPYFNSKINAYECQFIVGYQGLIELARRSGNIARIEARVVHENDTFDVEFGLEPKLTHRPAFENPGTMKCVYMVAELTDGSKQIEVMTKADIEKIRLRSKAKDAGPWKTDYEEMARKTVIRRGAKYLPLSTELEQALVSDDEQFTNGNGHTIIAEMAAATQDRIDAMKGNLAEAEAIEAQVIADDLPQENTSYDELDPETESLRAYVQEIFDGLTKSQQKTLIAGKPSISGSTFEQLEALQDAIEGIAA